MEDVPTAGESMKAVATATLQLDRLIPPERGKAVKTKTAVRIGKPYQQIVQFAEETQADMVVMGCTAVVPWIRQCLVRLRIGCYNWDAPSWPSTFERGIWGK
jgi:nucleotide-binding universal stress UspA family protein